jgi:hypothetical protein
MSRADSNSRSVKGRARHQNNGVFYNQTSRIGGGWLEGEPQNQYNTGIAHDKLAIFIVLI